jgi:uncharacterized protein (DUF302 family)
MEATLKKQTSSSYDEVLARLPEALRTEGFGVLTEIDVAQTLKQKLGLAFRRYKILGACNPTFAHQALSTTLDIGVLLPCNAVVYEGDDQRAVVLAVDPMQTVVAPDPRLADLAATVRSKLARALDHLS